MEPLSYTGVRVSEVEDGVQLTIPRDSGAESDGAWPALIGADHLAPIAAMARAVNPRFAARTVDSTDRALTIEMTRADRTFRESTEVALTRFSTGAVFAFTDRGIPLPLTVV